MSKIKLDTVSAIKEKYPAHFTPEKEEARNVIAEEIRAKVEELKILKEKAAELNLSVSIGVLGQYFGGSKDLECSVSLNLADPIVHLPY